DGTVKGDVIAAAQTVIVNGAVEGNLIVAAQTVTVNGTVRDAIVAAQSLELGPKGHITGNVNSVGATLEAKQGSAIDGALAIFASHVPLAGRIGRDVLRGIGRLELRDAVSRYLAMRLSVRGSS